jgi:hypothetical protein
MWNMLARQPCPLHNLLRGACLGQLSGSVELMSKKRRELAVSKDKMLTIYPTLHEMKERGMLKRIIKKLIHIRKGP